MAEAILISLTLAMMVLILLISLIPVMPGPAMIWAVAMIFGAVEGFERLTVLAAILITVFMIVGSTTNIWMSYLGMRTQGASCWSVVGALVGGVVGTVLVPVPVCGTLIGAVVGALGFEMLKVGDIRLALTAGRSAAETFFWALVVEAIMAVFIFATFIGSLMLTQ